ncbi:hypothetical protein LguiB_031502 [Lonicera macranthoides]
MVPTHAIKTPHIYKKPSHCHLLLFPHAIRLSLSKMALDYQKRLLDHFIQAMYLEGYINNEFLQLQTMKQTARPDFVVREVTLYCVAAQNLFVAMSYAMEQDEVDFYKLDVNARDMYDRSSSPPPLLPHTPDPTTPSKKEFSKAYICYLALNWTKKVFSKLRANFETLVQMERKIIDMESGNDTGF